MKKIFVLSLIPFLMLSACGGDTPAPSSDSSTDSGSDTVSDTGKKEETYTFEAVIPEVFDSSKTHTYSITYKDEYFSLDTTEFNKDFALLSFSNAHMNMTKEMINDFYSNVHFDNVYNSPDYDVTPSKDTIAYTIAHRLVDDKNVISVSIRGFNYGLEWVNNFDMGTTEEDANHKGFDEASNKVLAGLKNYLTTNNYSNPFLWINGYSRAGAISNMLAAKVLEDEELNFGENNLVAYTFEAPRCLSENNAKDYKNVFNVVNNADLIIDLPPAQYNLYRAGQDINIYPGKNKLNVYVEEYSEGFNLPDFVNFSSKDDSDKNANDIDNKTYLFENLLDDAKEYAINTRDKFVNQLKAAVQYAFDLFMSLKKKTLEDIVEDVKTKEMTDLLSFMADDGIAEYLVPFLDEDGLSYNLQDLKDNTNHLKNVILDLSSGMLTKMLAKYEQIKNIILRMIDMHLPEVIYPCLKECKALNN